MIIDNTDESIDRIIMSNDGTGSGLSIPSILISKLDGEKLKNYIEQNPS